MYEGGTHVVGVGGAVDDPELTAFFARLNYAPEMGALYGELLDGWQHLGGTLFNAFVDVQAPSKWGSWGSLRHLDDANPRWDALVDFNRGTPAWWEPPRAAFGDGVTLGGSDAGDTLRGSVEEDTLLGSGGDDLLIGEGGADRLHGGAGIDSAVLPGRRADYAFGTEGDAILATGTRGTTRLVAVETIFFGDEPGDALAVADLRR